MTTANYHRIAQILKLLSKFTDKSKFLAKIFELYGYPEDSEHHFTLTEPTPFKALRGDFKNDESRSLDTLVINSLNLEDKYNLISKTKKIITDQNIINKVAEIIGLKNNYFFLEVLVEYIYYSFNGDDNDFFNDFINMDINLFAEIISLYVKKIKHLYSYLSTISNLYLQNINTLAFKNELSDIDITEIYIEPDLLIQKGSINNNFTKKTKFNRVINFINYFNNHWAGYNLSKSQFNTSDDSLVITNFSANFLNTFTEQPKLIEIISKAGSGKSFLMYSILNKYICDIQIDNMEIKLPIFIKLNKLNNLPDIRNITYELFLKFIYENIEYNNFLHKLFSCFDDFKIFYQEEQLIFLLDGLDEMPTKEQAKITSILDGLRANTKKGIIIITHRPLNNLKLNSDFIFEILPLTPNKIENYVKNYYSYYFLYKKQLNNDSGIEVDDEDDEEFNRQRQMVNKIIRIIFDDMHNSSYQMLTFATNPLLLNIIMRIYPKVNYKFKTKAEFYEHAIDALFIDHDEIKGFTRDNITYNNEKIISRRELNIIKNTTILLSALAYLNDKNYFKENHNEYGDILKLNIIDYQSLLYDGFACFNIFTMEDEFYTFVHQSIQEYFVAYSLVNNMIDFNQNVYNKIIEKSTSDIVISLINDLDNSFAEKNIIYPFLCEMFCNIDSKSNELKINDYLSLINKFKKYFKLKLIIEDNRPRYQYNDISDFGKLLFKLADDFAFLNNKERNINLNSKEFHFRNLHYIAQQVISTKHDDLINVDFDIIFFEKKHRQNKLEIILRSINGDLLNSMIRRLRNNDFIYKILDYYKFLKNKYGQNFKYINKSK